MRNLSLLIVAFCMALFSKAQTNNASNVKLSIDGREIAIENNSKISKGLFLGSDLTINNIKDYKKFSVVVVPVNNSEAAQLYYVSSGLINEPLVKRLNNLEAGEKILFLLGESSDGTAAHTVVASIE